MKNMMLYRFGRIMAAASLTACASCGSTGTPAPSPAPETETPVTPPVSVAPDDRPVADNTIPATAITWASAARKISHDVPYAEYGRIHRISGNSLILTYHCGDRANYWDNIAVRRSEDNGATWSAAQIVVPDTDPNYYGFANPDVLVLQNGWLMLAYNGKGNPDVNERSNIQVKISKDRGATWGDPLIAATGRSWEPAMVQMPDGEILLFYSSEARWWNGPGSTNVQQEILMIRSSDNGSTWTAPKSVAYSAGNRDGMAVPLILKDSKGIVFPIESVNDPRSPYILWSSAAARFTYEGPGTAQNGRRWLASASGFGGAPYISQLNSGETILSYQDNGGRQIGSDFKKNTMYVAVGNSSAQQFAQPALPWPNLPSSEGAYYSSTFLKDDNTVVLVTTRNFVDGHSEIWWKEGTLNR